MFNPEIFYFIWSLPLPRPRGLLPLSHISINKQMNKKINNYIYIYMCIYIYVYKYIICIYIYIYTYILPGAGFKTYLGFTLEKQRFPVFKGDFFYRNRVFTIRSGGKAEICRPRARHRCVWQVLSAVSLISCLGFRHKNNQKKHKFKKNGTP